jgi:hypothetical protein
MMCECECRRSHQFVGEGKVTKHRTELARTLQPAFYKLDSELPEATHDELSQGKTDESEEPSS